MINLEEIKDCNNYQKLKKIALENNIEVDDSDKALDLKDKILNNLVVEVFTFTYIGKGAESPRAIKFMNKIDFIRGEAIDIVNTKENELIIKKLLKNPSFIEGSIEPTEIIIRDEKEAERVNQIIKEDRAIDQAFAKKHK